MKKGNLVFKPNSMGWTRIWFALSVLMLIMILFVAEAAKPPVEPKPGNEMYITYASHKIKEGDTLWSIAQQYNNTELTTQEYVSYIQKINNKVTSTVKTGNRIIIIYYSEK